VLRLRLYEEKAIGNRRFRRNGVNLAQNFRYMSLPTILLVRSL